METIITFQVHRFNNEIALSVQIRDKDGRKYWRPTAYIDPALAEPLAKALCDCKGDILNNSFPESQFTTQYIGQHP